MNTNIFFSDALQQSFDHEGIVSVPLLNSDEIAALLSLYQTTSNGISDRKFHSTMFINNADYRKQTDAGIRTIVLPKINEIVNNYRMLFANFIVKEPSPETRVGIHQDWNFTSPEYISINFWIPLVDINSQTGLFHAFTGSHHTFRNIRYTPYEDNAYAELENFIHENAIPFHVKAGNVLFYHGALVHFSDPNISKALRIAVGGAMIPKTAPNLHYYKREKNKNQLEVYKVNEAFYHGFDFFGEPKGVVKIDAVEEYETLPVLSMLKE